MDCPHSKGGDAGELPGDTTGVDTFGLYAVLQVSPNATRQDISRSFRKLYARYSRIKDPSPEERRLASQLEAAYSVLHDPIRRALYDRHGDAGLMYMQNPFASEVSDQIGLHAAITYGALVLVSTCIIAIIFACLIAAKIDGHTDMTWGSVFIPFWIFIVSILIDFGIYLLAKLNGVFDKHAFDGDPGQPTRSVKTPHESPAAQISVPATPATPATVDMPAQKPCERCYHIAFSIALLAYVASACIMGDRVTRTSAGYSVWIPIAFALLAEVAIFSCGIRHAKLCHIREQLLNEGLKVLPTYAVVIVGLHRLIILLFRIVILVLVGVKMTGGSYSWQEVFTPFYVFLATSLVSMWAKMTVKYKNGKIKCINEAAVLGMDFVLSALMAATPVMLAFRLDGADYAPSMFVTLAPALVVLTAAFFVTSAMFYHAATFQVEDPGVPEEPEEHASEEFTAIEMARVPPQFVPAYDAQAFAFPEPLRD